jgi:hypothetical protein
VPILAGIEDPLHQHPDFGFGIKDDPRPFAESAHIAVKDPADRRKGAALK